MRLRRIDRTNKISDGVLILALRVVVASARLRRIHLHARFRPLIFNPSIKVWYLLAQSRDRLLPFVLLLMGIKYAGQPQQGQIAIIGATD